jgi:hypothetical protein
VGPHSLSGLRGQRKNPLLLPQYKFIYFFHFSFLNDNNYLRRWNSYHLNYINFPDFVFLCVYLFRLFFLFFFLLTRAFGLLSGHVNE